MTEPATCQLAQELLDKIIDDLAASQREHSQARLGDLSSCSLVCKRFLPRSQSHLFHRIKIVSKGAWDNKKCIQRCEELNRIMAKSPHITTYIQELHLQADEDENAWLYKNPTFVRLMKQLSQTHCHLEKLTLACRCWGESLCNPQSFLDQFSRPFISPFITFLHIKGIKNAPIGMIRECVNLSELTLSDADFECVSRSTTSRKYISRPQLRSLYYSKSRGAIEKLVGKGFTYRPLHLSTLRILTFNIDSIDDARCAQSVISYTKSLEELYLINQAIKKSYYNYVSLEGLIDLTKMPKLHTLHVDGVLGELGQESLSGITSILKTVPSINCLRSLHLTIYVGFDENAGPEVLLDADWESLAAEVRNLSSGKPIAFHLCISFLDTSEINHRGAFRRLSLFQPPRAKISKSLCSNQLRRLVNDRLQILRRDPDITIFATFHLNFEHGGCLH